MPIRTEFIDWSRPALPAAADWLRRRYAANGRWDLRNVIVATPGGRAGRRLLELLVDAAATHALDLCPPRIETVGQLPEHFYVAKKEFADRFVQHLAWVAALRETRAEDLKALVAHPPDPSDLFAWLPLAELLSNVHRELAADRLDCAKVVAKGRQLALFQDAKRWKLLADIQRRYLEQLDAVELWDLQTARLFALDHGECQTACDVVVLGAVDMNYTLREMLDAVESRVTALVFAPPEFADRFDSHGCVIPDAWVGQPAGIPVEWIDVADGPGDQADAVVQGLARLEGRYAAEEIVVGVPDERLIPYVEQRIGDCGIPTRYGVGDTAGETEPCRLLAALADWVEHRRFSTLASLVRHPAVERSLPLDLPPGAAVAACDVVQNERLPWSLRPDELQHLLRDLASAIESCEDEGKRRNLQARQAAYDTVAKLVAELAARTDAFAGSRRTIGDWASEIRRVLVDFFGQRPLNSNEERDRRTLAACRSLNEALDRQACIPKTMAPRVSGAEAIRLALNEASSEVIPPSAEVPAIELLGWLELPLDDAPALIVTGMNESIVPATRNGDLFLPNELRKHLNLEDNDRRMARDSYALQALKASRRELRLIAGRRSPENDPLIPSRFLLQGDTQETARRILRFLGPREMPQRKPAFGRLKPGDGGAMRQPPRPRPLRQPAESMRITEFRDYLACPYRYYLRHRLGLETRDDAAQELGAPQFGNLLHDTLGDFGMECLRDPLMAACTVTEEIAGFLNQRLDALAHARFGGEPLPAVKVQIELARRRLMRFVEWQAGWARKGWRVRHVEQEIPSELAALPITGGTMKLRGRIDRIDVRDTGEAVVFDYKTGDSVRKPETAHWDEKAEQWLDLQLPLYRHACRWLDVGEQVRVGYVVLPRSEKEIGHHLAEWTEAMFESAVEEAIRIAELVKNEAFWPPRSVDTFPEFSAICGDYRLSAPVLADGEESSEE